MGAALNQVVGAGGCGVVGVKGVGLWGRKLSCRAIPRTEARNWVLKRRDSMQVGRDGRRVKGAEAPRVNWGQEVGRV